MSTARVICAGFGGQGVMSMGQLLTYAGMLENKKYLGYHHTDQRCVEVLQTVQ